MGFRPAGAQRSTTTGPGGGGAHYSGGGPTTQPAHKRGQPCSETSYSFIQLLHGHMPFTARVPQSTGACGGCALEGEQYYPPT